MTKYYIIVLEQGSDAIDSITFWREIDDTADWPDGCSSLEDYAAEEDEELYNTNFMVVSESHLRSIIKMAQAALESK